MCGIAGLVRFAGLTPDERGAGPTMAATLRHRGPDDVGSFHDPWASLGHTRLSIIDLEAGPQPMFNEDGRIAVIFNGEIYNHRALAEQLRARGHQLRTRCDTEVIAHLYEDFGESFVEHLNGMFAIAIWDSGRRTLLLARDRLGVKPLYWSGDRWRVVFGSELKAVLAVDDGPRRVDPRALIDYFTFGHVPGPRTIFEGIRKLEPGFLAVCTASGVSLRRYWDIPFGDEGDPRPGVPPSSRESRRWIEAFAALLQDAVAMRLISDVPIGAFLSGGVDSAAVVSAMRRCSAGPVLTHTVGFDDADHDERQAARQTARLLGTDHHEVVVRPDAARVAGQLTRHFDEPFADSSAVPTFYLSQVTRERLTVALTGDGGDEMLAGYRRYRFDLAESTLRTWCPAWLRGPTAGAAGWLYPKADWLPRPLRAKTMLQNLACDDITAHLRSVAIQSGRLCRLMVRPEVLDLARGYDPFDRGRELFVRCPSSDLLNRLLYVDMKTLMVDDILTKVDRASMAVGLEVRVPLLDYRLVELAARMPASMKLAPVGVVKPSPTHAARDKFVLRQVLAEWMGPHVANRPKKGFDVPLDAWFRGPLRDMAHDLLLSPQALCGQWVRRRQIQRLMSDHQHRLRANGQVLWTLLSLELWARAYARPCPPSRAPDAVPCGRGGSIDP